MTFQEVEQMFNRAFQYAFSKKKFLFMFPVLLTCGVMIVFCRALSLDVNPWVWMSLAFLPVFLCTGVLLAAGVLLTRMYYHEVKGLAFGFRKLLTQSFQLLVGVSYLSLPLVLTYLLLWTLLGVFFLLKGLPGLGDAMGVLLSFGPFLLVLGSFGLSIVSVLLLYFVTPHVALKNSMNYHVLEEMVTRLRSSLFANLLLFSLGVFPLVCVVGFLTIGAVMTGISYFSAKAALSVSLQWFFIMVPFCAILTPFVIFFFNFATESYGFLRRRNRERGDQMLQKAHEEVCT